MYQALCCGKRRRLVASAAAIEPTVLSRDLLNRRKTLYLVHDRTKVRYLVDSGCELSVLPPSAADRARGPRPTQIEHLVAANGGKIPLFGKRSVTLIFRGRSFSHTFLVAEVTSSIIGCDFLYNTGLLVDIRNARLWDPLKDDSISGTVCSVIPSPRYTLFSLADPSVDCQYRNLLQEFPALVEPLVRFPEPRHQVVHTLKVKGAPFRHRFRPLAPEKEAIAKKEFLEMERLGIIRRGKGQWASPLHMVRKANGSWRPCGDYRHLNSLTVHDSYPLPLIASFTDRLAGARVFSKIDLVRAYHQIPMAPADVEKTALSTPFGLWEFTRMPFGLRNSAQSFQRFMDSITADLDGIFVYLDDILVASQSPQAHLLALKKLFTRLNEHGLLINPDKCEWGRAALKFLGHDVSASGIQPLPERIGDLQRFPQPSSEKEMRRFLGMVNFYHRFIPGCARRTQPLNDMLPRSGKSTDAKLQWTAAQSKAFEDLRVHLGTCGLLTFPRRGAPTRLCTDASDSAIGAVLEQWEAGSWRPLGFHSRALKPPQRSFSAFDRELLAIHQAVQRFRPFLEACDFHIVTDHKPLTGNAMNSLSNTLTAKQQRWWSFITEFSTDIRHISGSSNVVADTLSRVVYAMGTNDEFAQRLAAAQLQDEGLCSLLEQVPLPLDCPFATISHNGSVLLGFKPTPQHPLFRPLVPPAMQEEVIASFHQLAHAGVKATQRYIKDHFGWRGMSAQISNFVRNCSDCQHSKVYKTHKAPLQVFLPPASRFLDLHIDIVGPLPQCQGQEYLFTIVDRFTRYPVAVPMPTSTTEDCARALLTGWIQHFGVPASFVSDRGPQFTSGLWAALSSILGVEHKQTTAYHPQCNGMVERMHRQLKAALRAKLTSDDWLTQLPVVLLGIRAAVKEDIGCSAAQMVFGASPRLPRCIVVPDRTVAETVFLRRIQETARNLAFTDPGWHGNDRPRQLQDLATCGFVHVKVSRVHPTLDAQYEGPFRVLHRGPKTFVIDRDGEEDTVSVDRLIPAPGVHALLGEPGSVPPTTVTRAGRASRQPVRFGF